MCMHVCVGGLGAGTDGLTGLFQSHRVREHVRDVPSWDQRELEEAIRTMYEAMDNPLYPAYLRLPWHGGLVKGLILGDARFFNPHSAAKSWANALVRTYKRPEGCFVWTGSARRTGLHTAACLIAFLRMCSLYLQNTFRQRINSEGKCTREFLINHLKAHGLVVSVGIGAESPWGLCI